MHEDREPHGAAHAVAPVHRHRQDRSAGATALTPQLEVMKILLQRLDCDLRTGIGKQLLDRHAALNLIGDSATAIETMKPELRVRMGGALLEHGGAGTFVGHTNGIVVALMQAARVARLLDILEPLLVEHLDPVLDAPARRSFRPLA